MTLNFRIAPRNNTTVSFKDVPAGTCFELAEPDSSDARTRTIFMKIVATNLEATNVLYPHHRDIACVDLSSGRLAVLVCGPVRMVRLTVTGKEYI